MRFINALVACSVIAIARSSVMAQSTAVQWTVASGGNGHWYEVDTNPAGDVHWTFDEAQEFAQSQGAHLATFSNLQENSSVYSLLSIGSQSFAGWFGLVQMPGSTEPGGGWGWVTGEPLTFSNWQPGEPTNAGCYQPSAPQNWGTLEGNQSVGNQQGRWDDDGNPVPACQSTVRRAVVEWSADCNNDGIVDYGQILSGELIDANSNGIPDICEDDPCPGDISGNGAVDGVDLTLLLGVWGTDGIGGEFDADITNDGIVGGADLTVLFSGWGPCPPPILPWATVLEQNVNPAVVTDATLRNAITATELPWRVRDNGTNIEMLLVPGGTFMMGCSPGDGECGGAENPAHQVTLTNAFYMSKTEVTQAQWLAKMGSNPSAHQGNTQFPVEMVSWTMAQSFCTTADLRLPTEAEWEYACRGRTITSRYGVLEDIGWFGGNSIGTQTVATKLPNALGLYDMLGNVHEWCQDSYRFYTTDSVTNPIGSGSGRLHRGGSIIDGANLLRASWRSDAYDESFWWHHVGFRVARNP